MLAASSSIAPGAAAPPYTRCWLAFSQQVPIPLNLWDDLRVVSDVCAYLLLLVGDDGVSA